MPERDGVQQKTRAKSSKTKKRKLSFDTQSWYAEAARKMSAARKPAELPKISAAPLVPD
jgi:hypothetical protein